MTSPSPSERATKCSNPLSAIFTLTTDRRPPSLPTMQPLFIELFLVRRFMTFRVYCAPTFSALLPRSLEFALCTNYRPRPPPSCSCTITIKCTNTYQLLTRSDPLYLSSSGVPTSCTMHFESSRCFIVPCWSHALSERGCHI